MKFKDLMSLIVSNDSNNRMKKGSIIYSNGLVKKIDVKRDMNFGALDIYGVVSSEMYLQSYKTNLSINLNTNNLIYTECDCEDYNKNTDFNSNYICKHIAATFLKYINELEHSTYNNEIHTKPKEHNVTKTLLEEIDKLEEGKRELLNLEVFISRRKFFRGSEFFEANFKIGNKKMFVLKNVQDFINAKENEVPLEYGKTFTYDPMIHYFTEGDEKIISFIEEYVGLNEAINRSFSYSGGNSSIAKNKTLLIPQQALRRFLLCCVNKTINFVEKENTIHLTVKEEELPLIFNLNDKGKEIVLSVEETIPEPFNDKYDVYIYKESLYLPPLNQSKKYKAFYNAFLESDTISFNDSNKQEVFNKIIPTLDTISNNINLDKKLKESVVKEELKIEFYLDKDKSFTWINVKLIYGEKAFDFIEGISSDEYIIRDLKKEHKIEDVLADLLFFRDKNRFIFTGDEEELYNFLCSDLKELKELGEVFYSDRFKDRKIYGTGAVKATVSEKSGNYLEFSFNIADANEKETMEILKAFKNKRKFYKLKNDSFINFEDDNIAAFFNLLDTLSTENRFHENSLKIDRSRAMYINSVIEEEELSFVEGKEILEYISEKMNSLDVLDFKIPEDLNAKLRDYQITGYRWLKTLSHFGFGGILADEMGLGKTLQTITFLLSEKGKKSIIITPTALIYNWKNEFEKFAPTLKVLVLHGNKEERIRLMEKVDKYDVILTTYGTLRNDFDFYNSKVFDYCVIDEGQNIKNPLSLSSEAVKEVKATTKFALTGTPIENSLLELWSIFDYIMPGYLFGKSRFLERFTGKQENIATLKKLIRPFILRRLKKDVIKELPDKIEKKFYVELSEEQQKIYSAYVKDIKDKIESKDENTDKITIFSYLMKLRQLCLTPASIIDGYKGGSGKIDVAMDIIEEAINDNHKILLFSQFTSVLTEIIKSLDKNKIKYYYLDGTTKAKERLKLVNDFNNDNEVKLFLISLKAGGTGLNLTSADMVIHFDPWWNPAIEDQATDRAHRLGQKRVVEVIKLIAKGTIEEKIIHLQESKKEIVDEIMDGNYKDGSLLSSLSEAEIKELFLI